MSENRIHLLFIASLIFKAVFAVFEIIGGIATYLIALFGDVFSWLLSQQSTVNFINMITRQELSEDPQDFIANYLLHLSQNFSLDAFHFVALYLFAHGVVKLWLVIGLLRKKLWYYPVAMVVFGLFAVYQLYRYTFTHSSLLVILTIVDLVVIWFTWHEYRYLTTESQKDTPQ